MVQWHCKIHKQCLAMNEHQTVMRAMNKIADSSENGVQMLVGKRGATPKNKNWKETNHSNNNTNQHTHKHIQTTQNKYKHCARNCSLTMRGLCHKPKSKQNKNYHNHRAIMCWFVVFSSLSLSPINTAQHETHTANRNWTCWDNKNKGPGPNEGKKEQIWNLQSTINNSKH